MKFTVMISVAELEPKVLARIRLRVCIVYSYKCFKKHPIGIPTFDTGITGTFKNEDFVVSYFKEL
jgi:hypothetical protein